LRRRAGHLPHSTFREYLSRYFTAHRFGQKGHDPTFDELRNLFMDLCDGPAAQFGCELGMNLQAIGGAPFP